MKELIHRVLQGVATPKEEQSLAEWLAMDEIHRREFDEAAETWAVLGRHSLIRPPGPPPSAEALIRTAHVRPSGPFTSPAPRQSSLSRPRFRRRTLGVAAAAASIAALAVVSLMQSGPSRSLESTSPAGIGLAGTYEFMTGSDETATLRLADGSIVRLAPNSFLRIETELEAADLRVVWLEGKAFFAVAEDERRTFVVRSPEGHTTVMGTRFEVLAADASFRVVVVDGRVSAKRGDEEVELTQGEMAQSGQGDLLERTQMSDVFQLLDWMGRTLVFHSTPLGRAIEEVQARFGHPIHLEDQGISELLITGTFANQSFEDVVTAICAALTLECSIHPDGATLNRTERRR